MALSVPYSTFVSMHDYARERSLRSTTPSDLSAHKRGTVSRGSICNLSSLAVGKIRCIRVFGVSNHI